jgi:hypothetical protein
MDSLKSNHFHPMARLVVRMAIVVCILPIIFRASGPAVKAGFPTEVSKRAISIVMPLDNLMYFPLIAGGNQPINNGDFELGPDQGGNPIGWTAYKGGDVGLTYSLVNTHPSFWGTLDPYIPLGNYSMMLGSTGYVCEDKVPFGFAAVRQTVKVPDVSDSASLSLVFDYIIYTQDLTSTDQYDRFEVHISEGASDHMVYADGNHTNPVGCDQNHLWRIPPSPDAWKAGTIDLKSPVDFRGETVTISFQNWNRFDHWYNTVTFLDSVQILVGPFN